jgi:hypothetical protein
MEWVPPRHRVGRRTATTSNACARATKKRGKRHHTVKLHPVGVEADIQIGGRTGMDAHTVLSRLEGADAEIVDPARLE